MALITNTTYCIRNNNGDGINIEVSDGETVYISVVTNSSEQSGKIPISKDDLLKLIESLDP